MTNNNDKESELIETEIRKCVKDLKKICIINICFPPFNKNIPHFRTSIELGITNLSKWFDQNYNVFVISKHFKEEDKNFRDSEWDGIKIYRLGTYHPYMTEKNETINGIRYFINEIFNPINFYKIIKIFKKEKPDVIFIGDFRQMSLAPLIAAKLLEIPFFIRYDSLCPLYPKEHACGLRDRIFGCGNCIEKTILLNISQPTKIGVGIISVFVYLIKIPLWNSSAGVFALNKFFLNLYQEWGIRPEKIKIVPTFHILPIPQKIRYYKELFNEQKKNGTKFILYAGRLSPEKGIEMLLTCFEILNSKFKNINLLIAGDGLLMNKIKKKSNEIKNIKLLGWQNDEQLAELYQLADTVVMPSLVPEGHPVVAEEAMQFNKPIIGFSLGGLQEILEKYPLGVPVNQITPQALANAIEIVIYRK